MDKLVGVVMLIEYNVYRYQLGAIPSLSLLEQLVNVNLTTSHFTATISFIIFGSRPSDHYFRSVCTNKQTEFFSAVFDPISIKLVHMLHVRV